MGKIYHTWRSLMPISIACDRHSFRESNRPPHNFPIPPHHLGIALSQRARCPMYSHPLRWRREATTSTKVQPNTLVLRKSTFKRHDLQIIHILLAWTKCSPETWVMLTIIDIHKIDHVALVPRDSDKVFCKFPNLKLCGEVRSNRLIKKEIPAIHESYCNQP